MARIPTWRPSRRSQLSSHLFSPAGCAPRGRIALPPRDPRGFIAIDAEPPLHRTRVPLSIDPDDIVAEDEILSILNVPPRKTGRVIRRKGAFFQSVKEACKCISLGL
ncbi:unnamed protein product [Musa acuminata subsp. burmannicoides]